MSNHVRRGMAIVELVLGDVAGAGEGNRSRALRRGACKVGNFVGAGVLSRSDAEAMLFDAATACGFVASRKPGDGPGAARSIIRKGLDKGGLNPWGGAGADGGQWKNRSCKKSSPLIQQPDPLKIPCDRWLERAAEFFDSLNALPDHERDTAKQRLLERGIDPHRAYTEYGIRWNWKQDSSQKYQAGIWEARSLWGITPEKDPDTGATSVRIPRGLVIAAQIDGVIIGLEVRCEDTKRGKYCQLAPKDTNPVYCIGTDGQPVIICEGAFDAALCHQETGGAFMCMASMGFGKPLSKYHLALCQKAPAVWYVKDTDSGGDKGEMLIKEQLPNVKVVSVPAGKDPTGLAKLHYTGQGEGLPTVRQWLEQCGIMPGLQTPPPYEAQTIGQVDNNQQSGVSPSPIWPGDDDAGNPCCTYPEYRRHILGNNANLCADLRGYGFPSMGLPTVLKGFGLNGWRVVDSQGGNGPLELVPGRNGTSNEHGCRAYLKKHEAAIRQAMLLWKTYKAHYGIDN